MFEVLSVIHICIAGLLIFLVLIQDSKGGGTGGLWGGGSGSVFGASGAVDFMTKLTRATAFVFALSCIILTHQISAKKDVIEGQVAPEPEKAETPPATDPAKPSPAPAKQ